MKKRKSCAYSIFPCSIKAIFATVIILSLLLSSCGQKNAGTSSDNASSLAENSEDFVSADTKTVVDCDNNSVTIPANVETIAALFAYTGHVTVLLEGGEKLVAVVEGIKRDNLIQLKIPTVSDLIVPFSVSAINIESLMTVKPDVVFLRRETAAISGEVEKLVNAGLPYVIVDYKTIKEQKYSIELIGEIINHQDLAKKYLNYYESTLAFIEERVQTIPQEKRVSVYHSVNEVVRTNHSDEISYEILDIVGGINVAKNFNGDLKEEKAFANVETIYLWDPDCIIVNESSAAEYLRTNEAFASLRCVREGRVYQLPVGASRWAHPGSVETPIAALYIAKTLYPDYFEDVDIKKETRDFYHNFWGLDLTDEEIDSIFSGVGMRKPKDSE